MKLKNKKILMFVADQYEDLELLYPRIRFLEEGAQVMVAGEKQGETYKGVHGYPFITDARFDRVDANDFDALVLAGGYAPDKLRRSSKVLDLTRTFNEQKKLIAFICHAGWIPASADILKGIHCTSVSSIKDDLVHAGAKWEDKDVVIDKHFISSRFPEDLPKYCPAIIEYLSKK